MSICHISQPKNFVQGADTKFQPKIGEIAISKAQNSEMHGFQKGTENFRLNKLL